MSTNKAAPETGNAAEGGRADCEPCGAGTSIGGTVDKSTIAEITTADIAAAPDGQGSEEDTATTSPVAAINAETPDAPLDDSKSEGGVIKTDTSGAATTDTPVPESITPKGSLKSSPSPTRTRGRDSARQNNAASGGAARPLRRRKHVRNVAKPKASAEGINPSVAKETPSKDAPGNNASKEGASNNAEPVPKGTAVAALQKQRQQMANRANALLDQIAAALERSSNDPQACVAKIQALMATRTGQRFTHRKGRKKLATIDEFAIYIFRFHRAQSAVIGQQGPARVVETTQADRLPAPLYDAAAARGKRFQPSPEGAPLNRAGHSYADKIRLHIRSAGLPRRSGFSMNVAPNRMPQAGAPQHPPYHRFNSAGFFSERPFLRASMRQARRAGLNRAKTAQTRMVPSYLPTAQSPAESDHPLAANLREQLRTATTEKDLLPLIEMAKSRGMVDLVSPAMRKVSKLRSN